MMQAAMAQISLSRCMESWKGERFRAWKKWFQMEQFFKSKIRLRFLRTWRSEVIRKKRIAVVLKKKIWLRLPQVREDSFRMWFTHARVIKWRKKMHLQIKGEMWYEWRHYVAMERYFKLRLQ